jgi:3-oxoacyl-[acyl-carrier protein] reductase
MMTSIRRDHETLDALINNAGIASMNHSLLTKTDTVRRIVETNLVATFTLCREAAKLMRINGGRIINMSSVAVPLALEGEAAYVASKAGVEALTKVLAQELGAYQITVNAIGPTPIDTDLISSIPESKIQALIERQAVKRMGTAEDVANVADFLVDARSDFISGQVVYLGGVAG